jgi:molecular chaperone HscB
MNYFEFFELPLSPKIDLGALKQKFYANSRAFHPDFYTLESPEKQAEVLEQSTLNNQAYKTLANPDARLKYFLEAKGVLAEEGQNQVPQDFLMEMMEINEALMELEFEDDAEVREKVIGQVNELEDRLEGEVVDLLEDYRDEEATAAELTRLKDYYLKRRYLVRMRENLAREAQS